VTSVECPLRPSQILDKTELLTSFTAIDSHHRTSSQIVVVNRHGGVGPPMRPGIIIRNKTRGGRLGDGSSPAECRGRAPDGVWGESF